MLEKLILACECRHASKNSGGVHLPWLPDQGNIGIGAYGVSMCLSSGLRHMKSGGMRLPLPLLHMQVFVDWPSVAILWRDHATSKHFSHSVKVLMCSTF